MVKSSRIIIALAFLALASCNVNVETELARDHNSACDFKAVIEEPGDPGSKVYADEDLKVLWHEKDEISIFNRNTYNRRYRFNGQTGDNSGSFSLVPAGDFVTGNELDAAYAVYPYDESSTISNSAVLSVTLPSVQTYAEKSFGRGANTMVAATEDELLVFKNLCGYLMFKLYGAGRSVSSLKLEGNNGEIIAGAASVTMTPGGIPDVSMAQDGGTSITLKCESPVPLGADAEHYTEFWFALPPVTFQQGIKLTISFSGGGGDQKSSSGQITIVRNTRSRMSPIEVSPVLPVAVDLGLSASWASFNIGAAAPEEAGDYYAWGELAPKSNYSWATYKWCEGSYSTLTKYNNLSGYGVLDNLTVLEPEDDVAHLCWGDWHMPTEEDWYELQTLCTWNWEQLNGVNGCRVTGPNGNSIFLPAAGRFRNEEVQRSGERGYYWNTSLGTYYGSSEAGCFTFTQYSVKMDDNTSQARYEGLPVRPVSGEAKYISIGESVSSVLLQKGADEALIQILSNQAWSAELLDVENDWLVIAEGASGEGDGVVRLSASENTGEIRYATLLIRNRAGLERYRIAITQDGVLLDSETQELRVGFDQAETYVSIASNTQWTVEKVNGADDWFSISTPDGTNGNSRIVFNFVNNQGSTMRKSSVLVKSVPAQAGDFVAEKLIVVKQGYSVQPVRHIMNDEELLLWTSDWDNVPVYTADYGTLFTARCRINRYGIPFGSYTFRWKDIKVDPDDTVEALRIRHWLCFNSGDELRCDLRPADGRVSFAFNVSTGEAPSLDPYYDVDWSQPVELTYKFDPRGAGYCHVSYLINGVEAASFDTSENTLPYVTWGADIFLYFGVAGSGSAVLDWYEFTPAIDWGD